MRRTERLGVASARRRLPNTPPLLWRTALWPTRGMRAERGRSRGIQGTRGALEAHDVGVPQPGATVGGAAALRLGGIKHLRAAHQSITP